MILEEFPHVTNQVPKEAGYVRVITQNSVGPVALLIKDAILNFGGQFFCIFNKIFIFIS